MTDLKVVGQGEDEMQPPSVSENLSVPTPFLMDRGSRGAYYLLPQLLERIAQFESQISGNQQRAAKVPALFEQSFCSDSPFMVCSVFVLGGRITTHALASIESVLGEPYLYVVQLAKDKGADGDINQLIAMGAAWGKTLGIQRILAYPAGEGQARLFARYGLKPIPDTMAMDLRAAPFEKE